MSDDDTLIVSFCNVKRWMTTAGGGTCIAQVKSGAIKSQVTTQQIPKDIGGATGLCRHGNEIVCLLQHPRYAIMCRLSVDLQVLAMTELSSVKRPHSICHYNGDIFIVSTGNDAVIKITSSLVPSTFWAPSDSEESIHLNSICATPDGRFYGTAFGHNGGPENRHRKGDGYIIDFSNNAKVRMGLSHPHSITWTRDGPIFCQSAEGIISNLRGKTVGFGNSYPRGLAITSKRIYVGISNRRTASISQSSTILTANRMENSGAEIVVLDWDGFNLETACEHHRIDLGETGHEIFDILVI